MRDELPKKPLKNETCVVNLDTSKGTGTHWVSYIKRESKIYYYDSFGFNPPKELIKYFGKAHIIVHYEEDQKTNEVICGHLCLLFLKFYHQQSDCFLRKLIIT